MGLARRILLIALTAAASLAAGVQPASPERLAAGSSYDGAELRVEMTAGNDPDLDVSLQLASQPAGPGLITIYVPRAFAIYPNRPEGSAVGNVFVTAEDSTYGTSTDSSLAGDIVAEQLHAAPPACGTGTPTGLWQLELSLLGQPLEIPMYLSPSGPGDPAGAGTKIELCVPTLPTTDPATARTLPITSIDLALGGLGAPGASGSYLWRAVVTPVAPDRRTLLPERSYELRAVVPVPHRLTLTGTYRPKSHVSLLHGRLTANGKPRVGVRIRIVSLVRGVTGDGIVVGDRIAGWATTNRSGVYTFRASMRKTTGFIAFAERTSSRCTGPAIAPGGCVSTTLPGTESDPITISVVRPGG